MVPDRSQRDPHDAMVLRAAAPGLLFVGFRGVGFRGLRFRGLGFRRLGFRGLGLFSWVAVCRVYRGLGLRFYC